MVHKKIAVPLAIFKKEFLSYFNSLIAYIVIVIFLLISGWFFASNIFLLNVTSIDSFLSNIPLLFVFIIPAITMRVFAEEYKMGTIEIITTLPVENYEIIIGKYLAAVSFTTIMILLTLVYPVTIKMLGPLDVGVIIGSYIGLIFLAAMFISIGTFASCLSKNQIIGFIIGFSLCFFFFIIGKILFIVPQFLLSIFEFLSIDYHFSTISKGIIDSRDIIYYITTSLMFLFFAYIIVENKK